VIATLAEVRAAISSNLPDDSLRDLMEAAEADIAGAVGPLDAATEYGGGGHAVCILRRPIGTISSVTEYADTASEATLAASDYRVDGYRLHRLSTGASPAGTWRGLVKVVHTPPDRLAEMKRAQIALLALEPSLSSGVITAERIGEYSVSYSTGSTTAEQRSAILDGLRPLMVA
jgi:hypothetical protein